MSTRNIVSKFSFDIIRDLYFVRNNIYVDICDTNILKRFFYLQKQNDTIHFQFLFVHYVSATGVPSNSMRDTWRRSCLTSGDHDATWQTKKSGVV